VESKAPAEDVQATALNGAQVTSLVGIVDKLALGQLPSDGAKALIQAAFPAMPLALVETMISSMEGFVPKPAAEESIPAPEPLTQEGNAFRPILADLLNRFARRMTKEAKAAPAKFQELLDTQASDHRKAFDDSLKAAVGVIAAIKGEKPEAFLSAVHGRFFAAFLAQFAPILDMPANDLAANVERVGKAFEDTIADQICDAVLA
jgi:hypothetical protein